MRLYASPSPARFTALRVSARGADFLAPPRLGDELARESADGMHAEDAVGFRVGQHLHEPFGLLAPERAPVVGEWEAPRAVAGAFGFELLLGLADPGDLGRGVDHPGDGLVIHMAVLSGDDLRDHHALVLAFVREHRTTHHVADRIDVGHSGTAILVDLDETLRVELDADVAGAEVIGIRHAPDRDDEAVAFGCFG